MHCQGRHRGVEERQDVRVLEARGGLDLGEEPLGADYGGQLRPQHLHRDLTVVLQVLGEVDRGHTALAQLALEAVAVRKHRGQARRSSCQWDHEDRKGSCACSTGG